MARPLRSLPNTNPPESEDQFGTLRDNPGNGTGTKVNEALLGDMKIFFEKLMFDAGIPFNGLPDNSYSGYQLNQALLALIGKKYIAIGDWNMITTASILVSHGIADFTKIRRVSVVIFNDTLTDSYDLVVGNSVGGINTVQGAANEIMPNQVVLSRVSGGFFDQATFDSTSFNRGYVTIEYSV